MEVIQIYTIVEAKTVNELVKLVNIKTKMGWICLGGMCHTPHNICESDAQNYPFCQAMYRMEKPKKDVPVKRFEAFPYNGSKPQPTPDGSKPDGKPLQPAPVKKYKKHYAKRNK